MSHIAEKWVTVNSLPPLFVEHGLKVDERLRLARERREQQQKVLGKTDTEFRVQGGQPLVLHLNI